MPWMDGPELLKASQTLADQMVKDAQGDIAFAREHNAIATEGPWEDVPAQQIAYVGIDETGRRVVLGAISSAWRFSPVVGTYCPNDSSNELEIRRHNPDGVVVRRVILGRPIPGMVYEKPHGQVPVQSQGLIGSQEFYFRYRGGCWSFRVGDQDVVRHPQWYYEEPYGDSAFAGSLTDEEAYSFIAKAAALYRSGVATMVMP